MAIEIIILMLLSFGWLSFRGKQIQKGLVDKYPPPGQMIDIGGFRLHLNCQGYTPGNDNPTVVMEAADFSTTWALVQPEIGQVHPSMHLRPCRTGME